MVRAGRTRRRGVTRASSRNVARGFFRNSEMAMRGARLLGAYAGRTVGSAFRNWRSRTASNAATKAGQWLRTLSTQANKSTNRKGVMPIRTVDSRRYHTKGTYGGKFKSVSRLGTRNAFDSYNRVGLHQVTETIGSVSDADCVYILNEVVNSQDVIKFMVGAMLRKLLELANFRVEGMDKCPFDRDAGTANEINYRITYVTQNMFVGGFVSTTLNIVAATTFDDIVANFVPLMEQYCSGALSGTTNDNVDEPLKFNLWYESTTGPIILSTMLFNETFVDIYGRTELKVQNRTKATGGSEDAENINSNPLQGRSYLFNGVPKPKGNSQLRGGTNSSSVFFERMKYPQGITTFGTAGGVMSIDFKEPPMAKQFWNCKKAANVRLEPGEIKKFNWSYRKVGNILRILKSIRLQLNVTSQFSTYSVFPVQMIAMEDVINANAAENISIQYEVERHLGVKCFVKQKKFCSTQFVQRT